MLSQVRAAPAPSFTPVRSSLLQRKCACGGSPGPDDKCEECRRHHQAQQRWSPNHAGALTTSSHPQGGHIFGHFRIDPPTPRAGVASQVVHLNAGDDEATERPSREEVLPGGEEPSDREEGFGGETTQSLGPGEVAEGATPLQAGGVAKSSCPTKTAVDKTIDTTPDGIKKGWRTGYGIVALMRVEPDSQNWDGTKVIESNKLTTNTCPAEFGISPCSGNSTFTVGDGTHSAVLGDLQGVHNRFFDHHITRWNSGSLLHDRNPKGIDSCQAVCEQKYLCGEKVIGTHTVTRTFRKGKSGDRDVTLVDVTKT
jgi:hypothetical protein